MYKTQLENDLREIFQIERVLVGSAEFGAEHDALFYSVVDDKPVFGSGKALFRVGGSISIVAAEDNLAAGYLHERYNLASNSAKGRFCLVGNEKEIHFKSYDRFFKKVFCDFRYLFSTEWNPSPNKTQMGEITLHKISI